MRHLAAGRADVAMAEDVLYVDGGIRDNFAIGHADAPPEQVLGLKVTWDCAKEIRTLDKYCARLAYCALSVAEDATHRVLDPALAGRICSCDVGDISTVDFNLGPSVVSELIFRGVRAARRFVAPPVERKDASTQTPAAASSSSSSSSSVMSSSMWSSSSSSSPGACGASRNLTTAASAPMP